ncbi:hypothetical protein RIF29_20848 [Crotalaria pallida]|uniref:Uncharacterized protein n=1 Tax=Crotalaria pallida TaxID=3830 RepID=A0AAN9F3E1_CROPI
MVSFNLVMFTKWFTSNQNEPKLLRRFVPRLYAIPRTKKENMERGCWLRFLMTKDTLSFQDIHKSIPRFGIGCCK